MAAKQLATLDVLSKGRVVVGIGVGWMREEFAALGLPPFAERGAVTDEYLQIFKELWTSQNPSFQGQYCQFDDLDFLPKPVQQPHPPIWVGGESRRALQRTARYANGWYPIAANPQFPMATPEPIIYHPQSGWFEDTPLKGVEEGTSLLGLRSVGGTTTALR